MEHNEIQAHIATVAYDLESIMRQTIRAATKVTVLMSRGHIGDGSIVERLLKANTELSRAYLEVRAEEAIYNLILGRECQEREEDDID